MQVQLIVVQGKPEGKVIPLVGPVFKIGRGETCHLRPNSERVSREHAEFTVADGKVQVRDLGSRNGTLVNGKALTQACLLKDRDLVQVGPLTFAVSIRDASQAAGPRPADPVEAPSDSWSVAENASAGPAAGPRASETLMIPAFLGPSTFGAVSPPADDEDDSGYERHPALDSETVLDLPAVDVNAAGKPPRAKPEAPNAAATEILRKMMERGRVAK